jgi:hypothetical protein
LAWNLPKINSQNRKNHSGGKMNLTEHQAVQNTARKVLLWTAAISTIFGIQYFVGLMGKLVVNGSIHAQSSPAISMVSAAVGLLWDVTLVILFMALRQQITGGKLFFANLGVVFMVLLAASSSINWYTQLTLIPRIAQSGDVQTLALLDIHNVDSVMYAIKHLAWGLFYGLAAISMGLAIEGGKIETSIRWLLIVGGVMSILFVPGRLIGSQFLIDLGYYAAGVLLSITTVLLFIRFRAEAK